MSQLVSLGDGAQVLKAPPSVAAVAPSTESTLKFQPMLIGWHITAGPLPTVEIAISDPVAAHCFAWLVVEMRRDRRGNDGLGSGDLLDG